MEIQTPLAKARQLRAAADRCIDTLDKEELLAAAVIQLTPLRRNHHVHRWLEHLVKEAQIEEHNIHDG